MLLMFTGIFQPPSAVVFPLLFHINQGIITQENPEEAVLVGKPCIRL